MIAADAHLTGSKLGLFDNWARYNAGDIYASIGWGGTQKSLNLPGAGMRGRVANGPLPGAMLDGKPMPLAYFNWGWSYVVARHCPEPDLAYRFCQFAVGAQTSSDAVAAPDGYFDPFREEHYSDPRIIEVYGTSFLREHQRAMTAPIPDLYVARRSEYFDALTFWLLRSLSGATRPDVALKNVENAWESTTEQVGRPRQAARWKALYAAYPDRLRPLWERDAG
jgi:multiple sugar transport system substrate-binding protein